MKGQEFATFKILLGAVFALALLFIVYALASGINPPTNAFSETSGMILQAYKIPGECISRAEIPYLHAEQLTASNYMAFTKIEKVEVKARSDMVPGVFISIPGGYSVKQDIIVPASVKCYDVMEATETCEVYLGSIDCNV